MKTTHIRIIIIILEMIKYRDKRLLLELIKAELLHNVGYLTELAMLVSPKRYHTIHKIFNGRVKFDYISIQSEIIVLILRLFKIKRVVIPIDDTIVYRSRKKRVPNGYNQYDHTSKPNRAKYVYGQRWLAFGLIVEIRGIRVNLPLFVYLVKEEDNLISVSANVLMKIDRIIRKRDLNIEVDVIADSWFAKSRLLVRVKHSCNFNFIVMARVDSVIYELPPSKKKRGRGRPRIKGQRVYVKLEDLDEKATLQLYSRDVEIKYKEKIVKAKFLDYEIVKAVWVEFDNNGSLRLIISSNLTLSATQIIEQYSTRWNIEVMFNELKNSFRFKDNILHIIDFYILKSMHTSLSSLCLLSIKKLLLTISKSFYLGEFIMKKV